MTLIYKTITILTLILIPHIISAEIDNVTHFEKDTTGIIMRECLRYDNISTDIVKAIIYVESRYKRTAVSHKGAIGLMQVMPIALDEYNRVNKSEYTVQDLYRERVNIRVGIWIYSQCKAKYRHRKVALFAYNAGMNRRWYDSGYAEKVLEAIK